MPGMRLGMGLSGQGAVGLITPPTYVDSQLTTYSSAAGSRAVAPPTGLADGDLILVVGFLLDDSATAAPAVSGFSQIAGSPLDVNLGATQGSFYCFYKIANSESGDYTVTWTGTLSSQLMSVAYRGVDQSTPFDANAATQADNDANSLWTITGLTTVNNNCKILFAGFDWADNANDRSVSGYTERQDGTIVWFGDKTLASAGSAGNISAANNAADGYPAGGFQIALRAAV